MTASGFALFETAIGACATAWRGGALCRVLLPAKNEAAQRALLRRRIPDASEASPPPFVRSAEAAIAALLRGEASDLSGIALDMDGVPAFHQRVYAVARTIPPGTTLTYGEIATRLGDPRAARDVGSALARNPFAIVVPCHRVVAAGGRTGGFTARGGVATKLHLLTIERGAAPALPLFAPR